MTTRTLGQAAKLAGVGKTTLTRAIKSRPLSAEQREDGSYRIDLAELFRAYEISVETPATGGSTFDVVHRVTAGRATGETAARQVALNAEIAGLREIVRLLDDQARDLRDERDAWRVQAENASQAVMLLTDQTNRRSCGSVWRADER